MLHRVGGAGCRANEVSGAPRFGLEAWALLSWNQIRSSFPHHVPLERSKRLLNSADSVVPARPVRSNPSLRKKTVLITRTNPGPTLGKFVEPLGGLD
jgi:hypothetical protein